MTSRTQQFTIGPLIETQPVECQRQRVEQGLLLERALQQLALGYVVEAGDKEARLVGWAPDWSVGDLGPNCVASSRVKALLKDNLWGAAHQRRCIRVQGRTLSLGDR